MEKSGGARLDLVAVADEIRQRFRAEAIRPGSSLKPSPSSLDGS